MSRLGIMRGSKSSSRPSYASVLTGLRPEDEQCLSSVAEQPIQSRERVNVELQHESSQVNIKNQPLREIEDLGVSKNIAEMEAAGKTRSMSTYDKLENRSMKKQKNFADFVNASQDSSRYRCNSGVNSVDRYQSSLKNKENMARNKLFSTDDDGWHTKLPSSKKMKKDKTASQDIMQERKYPGTDWNNQKMGNRNREIRYDSQGRKQVYYSNTYRKPSTRGGRGGISRTMVTGQQAVVEPLKIASVDPTITSIASPTMLTREDLTPPPPPPQSSGKFTYRDVAARGISTSSTPPKDSLPLKKEKSPVPEYSNEHNDKRLISAQMNVHTQSNKKCKTLGEYSGNENKSPTASEKSYRIRSDETKVTKVILTKPEESKPDLKQSIAKNSQISLNSMNTESNSLDPPEESRHSISQISEACEISLNPLAASISVSKAETTFVDCEGASISNLEISPEVNDEKLDTRDQTTTNLNSGNLTQSDIFYPNVDDCYDSKKSPLDAPSVTEGIDETRSVTEGIDTEMLNISKEFLQIPSTEVSRKDDGLGIEIKKLGNRKESDNKSTSSHNPSVVSIVVEPSIKESLDLSSDVNQSMEINELVLQNARTLLEANTSMEFLPAPPPPTPCEVSTDPISGKLEKQKELASKVVESVARELEAYNERESAREENAGKEKCSEFNSMDKTKRQSEDLSTGHSTLSAEGFTKENSLECSTVTDIDAKDSVRSVSSSNCENVDISFAEKSTQFSELSFNLSKRTTDSERSNTLVDATERNLKFPDVTDTWGETESTAVNSEPLPQRKFKSFQSMGEALPNKKSNEDSMLSGIDLNEMIKDVSRQPESPKKRPTDSAWRLQTSNASSTSTVKTGTDRGITTDRSVTKFESDLEHKDRVWSIEGTNTTVVAKNLLNQTSTAAPITLEQSLKTLPALTNPPSTYYSSLNLSNTADSTYSLQSKGCRNLAASDSAQTVERDSATIDKRMFNKMPDIISNQPFSSTVSKEQLHTQGVESFPRSAAKVDNCQTDSTGTTSNQNLPYMPHPQSSAAQSNTVLQNQEIDYSYLSRIPHGQHFNLQQHPMTYVPPIQYQSLYEPRWARNYPMDFTQSDWINANRVTSNSDRDYHSQRLLPMGQSIGLFNYPPPSIQHHKDGVYPNFSYPPPTFPATYRPCIQPIPSYLQRPPPPIHFNSSVQNRNDSFPGSGLRPPHFSPDRIEESNSSMRKHTDQGPGKIGAYDLNRGTPSNKRLPLYSSSTNCQGDRYSTTSAKPPKQSQNYPQQHTLADFIPSFAAQMPGERSADHDSTNQQWKRYSYDKRNVNNNRRNNKTELKKDFYPPLPSSNDSKYAEDFLGNCKRKSEGEKYSFDGQFQDSKMINSDFGKGKDRNAIYEDKQFFQPDIRSETCYFSKNFQLSPSNNFANEFPQIEPGQFKDTNTEPANTTAYGCNSFEYSNAASFEGVPDLCSGGWKYYHETINSPFGLRIHHSTYVPYPNPCNTLPSAYLSTSDVRARIQWLGFKKAFEIYSEKISSPKTLRMDVTVVCSKGSAVCCNSEMLGTCSKYFHERLLGRTEDYLTIFVNVHSKIMRHYLQMMSCGEAFVPISEVNEVIMKAPIFLNLCM